MAKLPVRPPPAKKAVPAKKATKPVQDKKLATGTKYTQAAVQKAVEAKPERTVAQAAQDVAAAARRQEEAYVYFMKVTDSCTASMEAFLLALAKQGVSADMLVGRAETGAKYAYAVANPEAKGVASAALRKVDLKQLGADCESAAKKAKRVGR